jgi:ATP-dependent DNA helicase RecG
MARGSPSPLQSGLCVAGKRGLVLSEEYAASVYLHCLGQVLRSDGIDIPNASVMVVEHAERFGLSQLHQLRGRIGRGRYPSKCILLAQYRSSEEARVRLRAMERTADGFQIAEEDLALRGPGEFFGIRQSGLPDFRVAHLVRDTPILIEARKEAFRLIQEDPDLVHPTHAKLKNLLSKRWGGRMELAAIG